jgi:hypothetical protein
MRFYFRGMKRITPDWTSEILRQLLVQVFLRIWRSGDISNETNVEESATMQEVSPGIYGLYHLLTASSTFSPMLPMVNDPSSRKVLLAVTEGRCNLSISG